MSGLTQIKEGILDYVKQKKNPYLTPVEIEQGRWLAGASHCTVRKLMLNGSIPSIKVGTTRRAHYQDVIDFLEKSYKRKSL